MQSGMGARADSTLAQSEVPCLLPFISLHRYDHRVDGAVRLASKEACPQ